MVVVAVIGLAATVVTPNVLALRQRQRLNAVSNQLLWDLRSAREKAIASHRPVKVEVPDTHTYRIWTDTNENGTRDAGEVQDKDITAQQVTLTSSIGTNPTSFTPLGVIQNSAVMTLTAHDGRTATITMTMAGSIALQ
jgi:Tfp pilus assembly protein FimT